VEVINEGALNYRKAVVGMGTSGPLNIEVPDFDTPTVVEVNLKHTTRKVSNIHAKHHIF